MINQAEILWRGKSEVSPNVWGFQDDKLGLNIKDTAHYGSPPSMFTSFVVGLMILLIGGISISMISIFLCVIFSLIVSSFLIYWFFIREIKYYQLVKNTEYFITEKKIFIKQKFLGKEKITSIDFDQIKQFYLIRFKITDKKKQIEKGTIHIYMYDPINSFDLVEKERNKLPKIQMVTDFQKAFNLLNRLKMQKVE